MLGILSYNLFILGCAGEMGLLPTVSNGFEQIAEHKSMTEQSAFTIKTNWASTTMEHRAIEVLYDDAKAAFDVWIERLRFDLALDNDIATSEHYAKSLHETAKKSDVLIAFAIKASATSLAAVPMSTLETLSGAGIKIWREYKAASKERRDEILKILGQLKWKHFKNLK